MFWIALQPSEADAAAWGWWALQFTPRVAQVDEAVVLEVSASLRLWGGARALLAQLLRPPALEEAPLTAWAHGATSLVALARLRHLRDGGAPVRDVDSLALHTLSAARAHLAVLARTGCRTLGDLRALPRAGLTRRFGAPLLDALDAAYGKRPEEYLWLTLPEHFDVRADLPALATSAPELLWTAQRLLGKLQVWLAARQRGVLAWEFTWTLDLRRLDGVALPKSESLTLRTAKPTQDTAHLRRLVAEHLARTPLAAPANALALRTLETVPWAGASQSLLPEDQIQGERLHELVERLSARLGAQNVRYPQALADHRPEHMQRWQPARAGHPVAAPQATDALYPTWLLCEPLRLQVHGEQPHYHGPLRLLSRAQRIEAGWWGERPQELAQRDYYIARSEEAGLLWIYCERFSELPGDTVSPPRPRWFLQGLYA